MIPNNAVRYAVAMTGLAVLGASAQGPAPVVRLTTPNATLTEEFSAIRGVRELSDGRVLVSDYTDERVVVADLSRGTVTVRVSRGGGPGEARLPTRLVPIPGDSTLLADLGNNRLLVLDGQGRSARAIAADHPGMMGIRGMDAAGVMYFAIPAWADPQGALRNDSVRLVKWNPRSAKEETIAVIEGDRMRSDIRQPAKVPRIPTVGYAAQDGWVLGENGVVRIVRAGSYRIESHGPSTAAGMGPSYGYATLAVSARDKEAYVREFLATSPMSGKGPGGGLGFSPQPSETEVAALVKGTEYAERHPMFSAADVIAAAGGRLWVGRPPAEGQPRQYDVFDNSGRRVSTVELLPGRRVMAVGRMGVYVLAESETGIQRLERYPVP